MVRITSPVYANSLTKVFNRAISNEFFPFEWKQARVTPLHKKGSRNMLNNYRPIPIVPAVSKVLERVLYEQLYGYFVGNDLLYMVLGSFKGNSVPVLSRHFDL